MNNILVATTTQLDGSYHTKISHPVLLRITNFHTKIIEKIKTHILCSVIFFSEIMWEKFVEPDRPQMTIWRMRIACWMTKATDTHLEYVILITFLL